MLDAKRLRALGNNTQASTRSIGMTAIFAFCARKFRGILFYKTNIPVNGALQKWVVLGSSLFVSALSV
jgi:hypothetical protein